MVTLPSESAIIPDKATGSRICLTPTRNEAWIIEPFIQAAQTWSDKVIIADQGSSDGTEEAISAGGKVIPIVNNQERFGEEHRQKILIDRAREIGGRRILIALDADEALSANAITSRDWELISQARPGTVLRFHWVNILPGFDRAWIMPERVPLGYVDDGAAHESGQIHCRRIPWPQGAPVLDLDDIVVLHFQYVLPERVASKHRWYQAWELLHRENPSALDIFRQYHHMHGSWGPAEIHPMQEKWLKGYDDAGIDFRSLKAEPSMWWDRAVVDILREHGAYKFSKLAIWDKDWNAQARAMGVDDVELADPRGSYEKLCHRLLLKTQGHREALSVRVLEKTLRMLGW